MITFFFAVRRSYLLFKFFRDSTSVVANPVWPVSQFFPSVHFPFTIAANRRQLRSQAPATYSERMVLSLK